jgi:hypothetical protein
MTVTEPHVITVQSDLAPDGRTYIANVHLDPDTSRALDRDQGQAWAATVLAAAARANHDALVLRQLLGHLGVALHTAAGVLQDLRDDRPPLDHNATAPMRLDPGVNQAGEPFIVVHVHGIPVGQWTCADARQHATHVLEVSAAVDLDAAFYRHLTGHIGLDPEIALNAVTALAYRPDTDTPEH